MMNEILVYWNQFINIMNSGGIIMWVLFALNLLLWYGIGYRYLTLKRGTRGNVRRLIEKHEKRGSEKKYSGLLDYVVADSIQAYKTAQSIGKKPRAFIYDAIFPYIILIGKYSILVKTIVILAPLVGLLGTVAGMIETFDALQSSSMFSQGDSIAGGISKALFTTELGLVVAVPGLIIGKILDKKEEQFILEFEQIVDILSTKDEK
ncbi:MotA/TolQ/ExbB proton channel family protein [Sulfurimonas sediminis]|uniref:MotA/TolQ/ExbB proton channel family protein n=2 Tax=Sulfurimonas sediminis TaxID=2590020 RepID=A0A7M1B371_9BACT|nr:MotA/TolQ/ExbB proton channel family protein [Sulfurimonas sp. SWIR-19]QOP44105.1 MotA/TolQ/ExbB proton channel family protein [Sulfurimonas sediminis]UCM99707.1 MotA/TolQ/ExbB proton channel family protein [Sulfurimonas sp. SWIR-19]